MTLRLGSGRYRFFAPAAPTPSEERTTCTAPLASHSAGG
jgi:hypothetical protein